MSQLIPNTNQLIIDNFCGRCGNDIPSHDNFCRQCGTQVHGLEPMEADTISTTGSSLIPADQIVSVPPMSAIGASNQQQLSISADPIKIVLNNRLYVGFLIALLGPLGLPALWFSPRFSKTFKIVATLAFVLVTIVLPLAIVWYFMFYSMRPLLDVLTP